MPNVALPASPLAPGVSPVPIHYRDIGEGSPLVVLHGGWGYEIYPFDRQIAALSRVHRILIPDRTGYGRSGRLATQEVDFHHRAAAETFAVIDALAVERPVLWGHSDGAVIALLMGLARPGRLGALIVEATHLYCSKPSSRSFFATMMDNPDLLGERVAGVLAREHGEAWRDLIRINGGAWLRIADERPEADADLYGGRLSELRVPTLVIHGAQDPRTEPGELDAIRAALPQARVAVIAEGGHSPHSERLAADEVTRAAEGFLSEVAMQADRPARR
ncbi:MAG TPA: alpha/beta fold hydrolase [Vicinamibacterales bacterium]|nr:alpha/beta fold hydrolase [Vicinamibacterales bacterium]